MRLRTLGLLSLLTASSALMAGPAEDAWEAYLAGDFGRVERLVAETAADTGLTADEAARLYLALGCSRAMQGRDSAAAAAFERALLLNPAFDLTPADLPPPVWKVWEPVRARMTPSLPSTSRIPKMPTVETNRGFDQIDQEGWKTPPLLPDTVRLYVPISHSSSAVLRSFAFPGLGHLSEGRRRGMLFMGLEAVTLSGWILTTLSATRAREDYLSASEPSDISSRYDKYNRYYRLSWGLGLAAVATYIAAQLDFFTAPPPVETSFQKDENSFKVAWTINL